MKKLIIIALALFSTLTHAELKEFDFYMDKSCEEMTNINSEDKFIQFAASEIREDLGENFCSKVVASDFISSDHEGFQLEEQDEKVGPAAYGKLIDSLYQYYEAIH